MTLAPTLAEIEALARAALAAIPQPFQRLLEGVVLAVEEFPTDDQIASVDVESPYDLSGLYEGRPVGDKSVSDTATLPDRIHLFRVPILLEWIEDGERLEDLITHIIVHEAGHHFGLSDEEMHAIENAAD